MNSQEIKFDLDKIDNSVFQLQSLQNRAIAARNMKFIMPKSRGDSKTVLLKANDEMVQLLTVIATMINNTIEDLNNVKTSMQKEDNSLAKQMKLH